MSGFLTTASRVRRSPLMRLLPLCCLGIAFAVGASRPARAGTGTLLPAPVVAADARPGASVARDGSGSVNGPSGSGLVIDASSRQAVVTAWQQIFEPALTLPVHWTGDAATCRAGSSDVTHADATIELVNWFRAMTGLPGDITRTTAHDVELQEAALMMIAQGDLSHSPMPPWACWTPAGADGAWNSLIALGTQGPTSIVAYIEDAGIGNEAAGHRRWILYPPQQAMGTASTDGVYDDGVWRFDGSNALWVFDPPGAPTAAQVAWPPAGYVPYPVAFPRWSLGITGADFSQATVSMQLGAMDIPVAVLPLDPKPSDPYMIGDPTLVWEPALWPFGPGMGDATFHVTVSGVSGVPGTSSISYDVTVIDPDALVKDADGDGVDDAQDDCPNAANPDQRDSGGIGSGSAADGIGDACQCGDVNGDGRVTTTDGVLVLRSRLTPPKASLPFAERCDVGGSAGCSTADAVLMLRALLTPPTAQLQQVCAPARGTP